MRLERRELNVAVVGALGRQGKRRVDAVSRVQGLRLRWVVGQPSSIATLEAMARERRCSASVSWQEAVDDSATDLVLVCTPNRSDSEIAVYALERGKHVLVEKPLAGSMEEATRIVEAANASSGRLKTGLNYPYRPVIKKGLDTLADGVVGEPLTIRAQIGHAQFANGVMEEGSWFLDPHSSGGGAFLDLGVHVVDLARRVFEGCDDRLQGVVA